MTVKRLVRTLGMIAVAGVALAACRAEEQGRMINYEPGVYKGKPDTKLSDAQVEALRQRSLMQAGPTGAGGGSAPAKSGNVRPPSTGLSQRTRFQGGN